MEKLNNEIDKIWMRFERDLEKKLDEKQDEKLGNKISEIWTRSWTRSTNQYENHDKYHDKKHDIESLQEAKLQGYQINLPLLNPESSFSRGGEQ